MTGTFLSTHRVDFGVSFSWRRQDWRRGNVSRRSRLLIPHKTLWDIVQTK